MLPLDEKARRTSQNVVDCSVRILSLYGTVAFYERWIWEFRMLAGYPMNTKHVIVLSMNLKQKQIKHFNLSARTPANVNVRRCHILAVLL